MPALAPVVDSLDKVPESARGFYEQKDGKHHLILDGAPAGFVPATDLATANGKVVEFRDKNITLLQEVEVLRPLKTQFDGIDPVAAREAITKVAELGRKGVTKVDDLAALIQSGIQAAIKPIQEQLTASTAETAAERKRADESVLRSQIAEKFLKAGGKVKAVDYIVAQAADVFKVVAGKVEALANKFSTNKPGEALGVEEWLVSAAKDHDFAFEPSTGAGANGTKGGPTVPGRPGQTVLTNPTPQQLGEHSKAIGTGKMRVEYTAT